MTDAPERIWLNNGDPKWWTDEMDDRSRPYHTEYVRADLYAALEQEREKLLAGMQFVDEKNARIKAENTRLREAIAEIDEAILGPEPTAPRVAEILRTLTEGENDG